MIRLIVVELRRYLHRRAVLLLLVASLLAPVVIGLITVIDTREPSAEELAEVAEREQEWAQEEVAICKADPASYGLSGSADDVDRSCRELLEPGPDMYGYEHRRLDLDQEQTESSVAVGALLVILLLLAGTTFTGHDWASRSVSNQLLFEPRRGRVWSAKALVVTGAALVVATVLMSLYWLTLAAVAESRDVLRPGQLLDALQMGWRIAGVAAAAALLGFALTTLFRSTVATVGTLLGLAVAGSLLLAGLGLGERWSPALNMAALVEDGVTYYDEDACEDDDGPEAYDGFGDYCEGQITFTDASLYLGTGVLVSAAASLLSFRRRDVP